MTDRVIIHLDMDAFFASIEMLDYPILRGKPVIVGGSVRRGVVSAASYEARAFGVHSAQPMAQALRCCPRAIVQPVRMDRYREVSHRIMQRLGAHTPLLEPVSVDEAYLDMTHWLPSESTAEQFAVTLRDEIFRETELHCSLGVATGKAIAKMASDLRKPRGLVVVPAGEEAAFLAPLAIGQLRGVGEATERKLLALGVRTIGELARLPEEWLLSKFGAPGRELLALARGHDDSPVTPERQAKSLGRETTFLTDVTDRALLERTLLELADAVSERLRRHALLARGVTLKIRYDDFSTYTRAQMLPEPADTGETLYHAARELLRLTNPARPVRLIGVTAAPLLSAADRQLSLFTAQPSEKHRKIASALDTIRSRFGDDAITRASLKREKE